MNLTDTVRRVSSSDRSSIQGRAYYAVYGLVLAVSVSLWFTAIRYPLGLDETGSYRQISSGFSEIWSRQNITFPAYSYILWLSAKILGTSEVALRIPSVLAMLGAVYLLYLAARELFEPDIAIIASILFCLHPIVIFESIDVRPYAFAALATNAAILILVRLRRNNSNWLALLLGLSAACIVWFQYLFTAIVPAIVLCLFVVKNGDRKALWRQAGVALAAFVLAFLPVIPGLHYLFSTARAHVFELAPRLGDLLWTLAPGFLPLIFGMTALIAAVIARSDQQIHFQRWQVLLCASLALIPILILYGVSVGTSIHMFTPRHRLVAIPGIALCWALILSPFRSRAVRLLFCVAFVSITAYPYYNSPLLRGHSYTWKYALEAAEKSASADNAPVLICSDYPESDYEAMPLDSAKDSPLFAQLSYYKLSVPVVPLPRALNDEAVRVGSRFLQDAARKHERFLAVAVKPSYGTLNWLTQSAAATYSVSNMGEFDNIAVLEFVPRSVVAASR